MPPSLAIQMLMILTPPFSSKLPRQRLSLLISTRFHHNHNHQGRHDQRTCDPRDQRDAAPARREFAPYDPVLAAKISPEPDEEKHDADAQERRTEGLAHLSQAAVGVAPGIVCWWRDIETETIVCFVSTRGRGTVRKEIPTAG